MTRILPRNPRGYSARRLGHREKECARSCLENQPKAKAMTAESSGYCQRICHLSPKRFLRQSLCVGCHIKDLKAQYLTVPLWRQKERLQWQGQSGADQRRCPNYESSQTQWQARHSEPGIAPPRRAERFRCF